MSEQTPEQGHVEPSPFQPDIDAPDGEEVYPLTEADPSDDPDDEAAQPYPDPEQSIDGRQDADDDAEID